MIITSSSFGPVQYLQVARGRGTAYVLTWESISTYLNCFLDNGTFIPQKQVPRLESDLAFRPHPPLRPKYSPIRPGYLIQSPISFICPIYSMYSPIPSHAPCPALLPCSILFFLSYIPTHLHICIIKLLLLLPLPPKHKSKSIPTERREELLQPLSIYIHAMALGCIGACNSVGTYLCKCPDTIVRL